MPRHQCFLYLSSLNTVCRKACMGYIHGQFPNFILRQYLHTHRSTCRMILYDMSYSLPFGSSRNDKDLRTFRCTQARPSTGWEGARVTSLVLQTWDARRRRHPPSHTRREMTLGWLSEAHLGFRQTDRRAPCNEGPGAPGVSRSRCHWTDDNI